MSAERVHQDPPSESARIQRFLYGAAICTGVVAALVVLAIATVPFWIGVISHERERRFVEPYVAWTSENVLEPSDAALQAYVERVGRRVADAMDLHPDLEISFAVVRGSSANAATTLGGHIFVVEALMRELDTENGLAMVLAHEIAHAKNRDPLKSVGRGILIQLLLSSVSGGGVDVSSVADFGSDLMLNAYSRDQEAAADSTALIALYAVYGRAAGATQLFESLLDGAEGAAVPDVLSSHPNTEERIAALERMISRRRWTVGETTPYPAEIVEAMPATAVSSTP